MDATRDPDDPIEPGDANNTCLQIWAEEQLNARAEEMCVDQQSNLTAQLDQLPTDPMVQDGSDMRNVHQGKERSPSPSAPTIPCKRKSRPRNFHEGDKWPLDTRPRKVLVMDKESEASGNRGLVIGDFSTNPANVGGSTATGNYDDGFTSTIADHGDDVPSVGIPSGNNPNNMTICTAPSGEPTLDNSWTNATTSATVNLAANDIGWDHRKTDAVLSGDSTVAAAIHLDSRDLNPSNSIMDNVNDTVPTSSGIDGYSSKTILETSRSDAGVESESQSPNVADQREERPAIADPEVSTSDTVTFGDSTLGSVVAGSSALSDDPRTDTSVESFSQGLTHESSQRPEQPGPISGISDHITDRSRAHSTAQGCDIFHVDLLQSHERQSNMEDSTPSSNADFSTSPESLRVASPKIPSLPQDVIAEGSKHEFTGLADSCPEHSVDNQTMGLSDDHVNTAGVSLEPLSTYPLGLDQGRPPAGDSSNERAPGGRLLDTQPVMGAEGPSPARLAAHSSREDSLPAVETELSNPHTIELPTPRRSNMTATSQEAAQQSETLPALKTGAVSPDSGPSMQVREYSGSPVVSDNESIGSRVQPRPAPRSENVFMFPSTINENANYDHAVATVQPFSPPVLQEEPQAMDQIPLEELVRKIKPRKTVNEAPVAPKNVVEIGGYGLRSTKNRLDASSQSRHISAKKKLIRGRQARAGKNLTKSFSAPELNPVKIPEGMALPTNGAFDFQFPSSSMGEGSPQVASNHHVNSDVAMGLPNGTEPNETSATRSSPPHGLFDAPMHRDTRGTDIINSSANGFAPVMTGAPATIDTGPCTQDAIKQPSASATNIATTSNSNQTMFGRNELAYSSHAGPSNVQTPPGHFSFEEPEFGDRHSSYLNMDDILPVSIDDPQDVTTRAGPLRADSSQASLFAPGRKQKQNGNDKGKGKGKQKQKQKQKQKTQPAVTVEEVPDESTMMDTDQLEHNLHDISRNNIADAAGDTPPQNAGPSVQRQPLPESQQPATKGDIARLDLQVSKLNTFAELILLRERESSIDHGSGPAPSAQASHTTRDPPAGESSRPEPQPEPLSTTDDAAHGDEGSSRPWTRSQKKGTTLHGFQHATPEPKIRSPKKNNINACIRELTKTLLGYNDSDSPFPIPDLEKVQEFDETLDLEAGPSIKYFRCDIYGESFNSNWNLHLAEIFVEEWAAADEFPTLDDAVIEKAFLSHFKYLKDTKYKQTYQAHTASPRSNTPRRKARSPREAKVYTRRTKRKTTLYDRREASAHYHTELVEFIYLLHRLSSKGMSDDESDHEHGTHNGGKLYKIIEPEWRAPFLKTILRIMDLLYVPTKFDADGIPERGCWPRYRKPSLKTKKGKAIVGLPSNWYNQVWLGTLSKSARRELDIQPPVEIIISESVKREAARYLHIDAENHKPDDPDNIDLAELDHWLETGKVFARD